MMTRQGKQNINIQLIDFPYIFLTMTNSKKIPNKI